MADERVLLIVDDQPLMRRALQRNLVREFGAVHLASNPQEAEAILRDARPAITHLICDFYLGDNVPLGTALVAQWRGQFPCIQLAVIISGSELGAIACPAGVDAVLAKPLDIQQLRSLLEGTGTSAG